MKVKLNKAQIANGKACKSGATVEVSDRDAKYLIASGRAEQVKAKAKSASKTAETSAK
ncbi:hypothetical protein THIOSC15_3450009 [uncultured Thiomicrorhabdus sp.]